MKTLLLLALLGACVAVAYGSYGCYGGYEYKCVKDYYYKKCKAIKVCENYRKEKCGYDYCGYGYVCASKKKEICKDFIALKKKCEKKKVCKEVKKSCGYDYCGYDEDCVKSKVCKVKYGYGRRLMGSGAHAEARAYAHDKRYDPYYDYYSYDKDEYYGKKYGGFYYKTCDYCKKKAKLECYHAYSCVKKEPCKKIVLKKCVKDKLRPGHDVCHGGKHFDFDAGYIAGAKCGDEYCGSGYKCANIYYQTCSGYQCGDHYCKYGYECVSDYGDCKKYAYLESVCKDVYEPTCVALGYYAASYYYPKCKTVYKCDDYDNVCGGKYCGYGYTCAVEKCGYYGKPYYKTHHKDPHYYDYDDDDYKKKGHYHGKKDYDDDDYKKKGHYHGKKDYDDDDHKKKGPSSAHSSSHSSSTPYGTYTDTYTKTTGHHAHADASGKAKGPYGKSKSDSYSRSHYGKADAGTHTKANGYYAKAGADADAHSHGH